jgi:hypothetical protein
MLPVEKSFRAFAIAFAILHGSPLDIDDPRAGDVSNLVLGRREPVGELERGVVGLYSALVAADVNCRKQKRPALGAGAPRGARGSS